MQYIQTIVYIHKNPVGAGLCRAPQDYKYSSYNDYIWFDENSLVNINEGLKQFGDIKTFEALHEKTDTEQRILWKISDADAVVLFYRLFPGENILSIQNYSKAERDLRLSALRSYGLPVNQICRITGLSRGIVSRVK